MRRRSRQTLPGEWTAHLGKGKLAPVMCADLQGGTPRLQLDLLQCETLAVSLSDVEKVLRARGSGTPWDR